MNIELPVLTGERSFTSSPNLRGRSDLHTSCSCTVGFFFGETSSLPEASRSSFLLLGDSSGGTSSVLDRQVQASIPGTLTAVGQQGALRRGPSSLALISQGGFPFLQIFRSAQSPGWTGGGTLARSWRGSSLHPSAVPGSQVVAAQWAMVLAISRRTKQPPWASWTLKSSDQAPASPPARAQRSACPALVTCPMAGNRRWQGFSERGPSRSPRLRCSCCTLRNLGVAFAGTRCRRCRSQRRSGCISSHCWKTVSSDCPHSPEPVTTPTPGAQH